MYPPVSQMRHCPDEAEPESPPVSLRYRPALQSMQLAEPAVAWSRPAALKDDIEFSSVRLKPTELQLQNDRMHHERLYGEASPGLR